MVEPSLSPGAAARRLGVAAETLRSWDRRYGIGPTRRSPGGHRRYTGEDLARLRHMCRLIDEGTAPAEAAAAAAAAAAAGGDRAGFSPGPRRSGGHTFAVSAGGPASQGLARAAMRLDAPTLERLLTASIAERGVISTWQELAMPVLYGMGRKWSQTDKYVEVEHLLTWSISTTLRRVTGPEPVPSRRRPALLACVPDELHTLPLEVLGAALTEQGVAYRMLGATVPAEAVASAIRRTAPAAVVLWSLTAAAANLESLRAASDAVGSHRRRETTATHTAGPGWPPHCRRADSHLDSLPTAVRNLA